MFASRSCFEISTWVWFGVQTIAASGLGRLDDNNALREGKHVVWRSDAVFGPVGAGSIRASSDVNGCDFTD